MKALIWVIILAVWVYILWVMRRAKIYYGYFIVGCFGLFIFSMILIRPIATKPLAQCIAAMAGIVGDLTGTFTAFFRYSILFIETQGASITLQIDFECSGIIELIAYISLIAFYQVYTFKERWIVGIMGSVLLVLFNVLRIIVICVIIHFGGVNTYYISHSIIGRIIFYICSVLLYFYVFTKPQIVRTKLGKFAYGHN